MEDQLGRPRTRQTLETPEKPKSYRPPQSNGRLAAKLSASESNRDVFGHWTPALSYQYSLHDIKNQFTPAEHYRHQLVTSGKIIRQLLRLETRWNKNYEAFVKAAIKIQSLHRGNVGRAQFNQVKEVLKENYRHREAKSMAMKLFKQGKFNEISIVVDKLKFYLDLAVIKLKSLYKAKKFSSCVEVANQILGLRSFFKISTKMTYQSFNLSVIVQFIRQRTKTLIS